MTTGACGGMVTKENLDEHQNNTFLIFIALGWGGRAPLRFIKKALRYGVRYIRANALL